jgi:hypothetical protein
VGFLRASARPAEPSPPAPSPSGREEPSSIRFVSVLCHGIMKTTAAVALWLLVHLIPVGAQEPFADDYRLRVWSVGDSVFRYRPPDSSAEYARWIALLARGFDYRTDIGCYDSSIIAVDSERIVPLREGSTFLCVDYLRSPRALDTIGVVVRREPRGRLTLELVPSVDSTPPFASGLYLTRVGDRVYRFGARLAAPSSVESSEAFRAMGSPTLLGYDTSMMSVDRDLITVKRSGWTRLVVKFPSATLPSRADTVELRFVQSGERWIALFVLPPDSPVPDRYAPREREPDIAIDPDSVRDSIALGASKDRAIEVLGPPTFRTDSSAGRSTLVWDLGDGTAVCIDVEGTIVAELRICDH